MLVVQYHTNVCGRFTFLVNQTQIKLYLLRSRFVINIINGIPQHTATEMHRSYIYTHTQRQQTRCVALLVQLPIQLCSGVCLCVCVLTFYIHLRNIIENVKQFLCRAFTLTISTSSFLFSWSMEKCLMINSYIYSINTVISKPMGYKIYYQELIFHTHTQEK